MKLEVSFQQDGTVKEKGAENIQDLASLFGGQKKNPQCMPMQTFSLVLVVLLMLLVILVPKMPVLDVRPDFPKKKDV